MLEVLHRDGRARITQWKPSDKASGTAAPAGGPAPTTGSVPPSPSGLRGPGLIWPATSFGAAPPWAVATLTAKPTGAGNELVAGGTWFHPMNEGAAGLVVAAPQTAPSTTVQVLQVGASLAVFHDAAGWAGNPRNLVGALIKARLEATPARLLWAPGVGVPADYALWTYLGVDLWDASPLMLAAARGQGLTPDGPVDAAQAARLSGAPAPLEFDALLAFNVEEARREFERIQAHIRSGTLRNLVERRIYASAASVEILRRFDREHKYLDAATPRHRETPMPAMTADALWSPEVEAYRRAVRDNYEPPRNARVLVILPCSQGKPYKTSRSHRIFARALDDSGIRHLLHEVMVTSPLGIVPRELEEAYPANQYDIPVTGHWLRDEEALVKEQLAAILAKREYEHVIVHAGQSTFDLFRHLLPEHVRHTCLHHPTSPEDLQRLRDELARVKAELAAKAPVGDAWRGGRDRRVEDLRALLSFQFNAAIADEMTEGAGTSGRMPYVKLLKDDVQLGTTTPMRGVVSLTLDGARILARHGRKRVFIGDFRPKGTSSLFAVGVESADPDIHPGDEVVVIHKDDVRGCGVAEMSGEEMTHVKRGIAVTLRHSVKEAKA